jgi:hypothetical protein
VTVNRVRLTPLAALAGLLTAAGCGGGPKIVPVSGVATYKGEPVPSLLLNFQPDNGRPSWGVTDAGGRFTLDYDPQNKGAVVGTHTVSATYRPGTPEEEMGMVKKHKAIKPTTDKYGDTMKSPLKVTISGPTDNLEVKFD